MFSFAQTKAGYAHLWDTAKVYSAKVDAESLATSTAKRIIALRSTFDPVEKSTGVPWWMVGGILYRESNLNVHTYLGNGQSLSHRTTVVPIGRGPFSDFLSGAVDAIRLEKLPSGPYTIELALYCTEKLNGFGYFALNVNSPYVWNWTDLYQGGKYVADHKFDRSEWDVQGGVAAIWKELFSLEKITPLRESGATPTKRPDTPAPPVVITPSPKPGTTPADDLLGALHTLFVDIPLAFQTATTTLRTDVQRVLDDVAKLENILSPPTVGTPAKGSIMNAITQNPVTSSFGAAGIVGALWSLFQAYTTKDPAALGNAVMLLLSGLIGLFASDGSKKA